MCLKCDMNRQMVQPGEMVDVNPDGLPDPSRTAEMWEGVIDGVRRYFDIYKIKQWLLRCPVPPDRLRQFDVAEMWHSQVCRAQLVAEHIDHVTFDEPVLIGTLFNSHGDVTGHVMDGQHRVAKAFRLKIKTLPAIQLSVEATEAAEVPEDLYVMSEITRELVESGAVIKFLANGTPVICGGKCPQPKPGDSPARVRMLRAIAGGPAVVNLS